MVQTVAADPVAHVRAAKHAIPRDGVYRKTPASRAVSQEPAVQTAAGDRAVTVEQVALVDPETASRTACETAAGGAAVVTAAGDRVGHVQPDSSALRPANVVGGVRASRVAAGNSVAKTDAEVRAETVRWVTSTA